MSLRSAASLFGLIAALASCRTTREVASPAGAEVSSRETTKLHLRDGRLIVASAYENNGAFFQGTGTEYDVERVRLRDGSFRVPVLDVVLVEVEGSELPPQGVAMLVMTGVSTGASILCLANPKACFGSCPTFYVPGRDATDWVLQAEGFSTSIASSLEADDLDDLSDAKPRDGVLTLAMRNEAFETHAVRRVSVLAVDGPVGSRVFVRPDGRFDALGEMRAPESCSWAGGDCGAASARDGVEIAPVSDGKDLVAPTQMTFRFAAPAARRAGLVLTGRNSLMSTFVLYTMYALHGREAGAFVARIERKDPAALVALARFGAAMGKLDVEYRQGDGAWKTTQSIGYIGPIAQSTQTVPLELDESGAPVEVRLSMAGAHWKIDALSLGATMATELEPVEVSPSVERAVQKRPAAIADLEQRLRGAGEHVVTVPGDELELKFAVPASRGAAAYFLKTRGYYYEWMRKEWLDDQDLPKAAAYLRSPQRALRELAPEYARVEPSMDAIFKASRFTRAVGR